MSAGGPVGPRRDAAPERRALRRGERLGGRTGAKLWTVLDGLVGLCLTLPDGRRQIVCLSVPGDVVCPVSRADGATVWIEALAPSSLCGLDLRSGSAILSDAALGAELFRMAHDQARSVSAHLVVLGRLDGMERVCLFLADMAWRTGCETAAGRRVRLPLSREDIADYLGLNTETVSRILGRVKKAGLATFLSPTEYLVPDLRALQERAPLLPHHAPPTESARSRAERGLHLM